MAEYYSEIEVLHFSSCIAPAQTFQPKMENKDFCFLFFILKCFEEIHHSLRALGIQRVIIRREVNLYRDTREGGKAKKPLRHHRRSNTNPVFNLGIAMVS